MKLPSHTTRYFAEQAYRALMTTGRSEPRQYKTVQGVMIVVSYCQNEMVLDANGNPDRYMLVEWQDEKGNWKAKTETVRKAWMGY